MGKLLEQWKLLQTIIADQSMSRADIAVASVLLDMAGSKGFAFPSLATLATITAQTERNVIRCVDRLSAAGYFQATAGRGRGHSKTYRPNFSAAKKVTAMSPNRGKEKVTASSSFPTEEKVTSASGKGDMAVQKRVTRMSPRTSYMNQLKEPARDLALAGAPQIDPVEQAFEAFWLAYPAQRRAGRSEACKKFTAIVRGKLARTDELVSGAERYKKSRDDEDAPSDPGSISGPSRASDSLSSIGRDRLPRWCYRSPSGRRIQHLHCVTVNRANLIVIG